MTAHDHAEHVEGCFRCDLSRDEMTDLSERLQAAADGWAWKRTQAMVPLLLREAAARIKELETVAVQGEPVDTRGRT